MPTYEYACKSCGEHLEVVQSFKDEPLTTCPNCGGDLRKVFGSIGIAFKGSGFYRTDSRAGSKSAKTKKEAAAATTSSSESSSAAPSSGGSSSGGSSAEKSSTEKSASTPKSTDSKAAAS